MSTLLLFFLAVFILLLLIILTIQVSLLFYWLKLGVPFVPSKNKIISSIIENIPFSGGKKFYDLGSGDGEMLFTLAKKYPETQFIGLELNPVLCLFSKIFHRQPNLVFRRENFFQTDLRDADYIYLFLYPELMNKIFPKLKSELGPEAVVLSNQFQFQDVEPEMIFPSSRPLETLRVYKLSK